MQRSLFEAGRHRGHDPLGYHRLRDASGRLVHPRQLVIDAAEAVVVRRVFHELSKHSLNEVADLPNQQGVQHHGHATRSRTSTVAAGCISATSSRSVAATSDRACMKRS